VVGGGAGVRPVTAGVKGVAWLSSGLDTLETRNNFGRGGLSHSARPGLVDGVGLMHTM